MTACSALGGLLAVLALLQAFPGALAQPFPNLDASIQMSTNAYLQGGSQQVFNASQYLTVRCLNVASCYSFKVSLRWLRICKHAVANDHHPKHTDLVCRVYCLCPELDRQLHLLC